MISAGSAVEIGQNTGKKQEDITTATNMKK